MSREPTVTTLTSARQKNVATTSQISRKSPYRYLEWVVDTIKMRAEPAPVADKIKMRAEPAPPHLKNQFLWGLNLTANPVTE